MWILLAGSLPLSVSALSPRAQDIYNKAKKFIEEEISPVEAEIFLFTQNPANKWKVHPKIEEIKVGLNKLKYM